MVPGGMVECYMVLGGSKVGGVLPIPLYGKKCRGDTLHLLRREVTPLMTRQRIWCVKL